MDSKMSINISISNIAKIKKANVKINGLTVISGENDTGKSTVGKTIYSLVKSINSYNKHGVNVIKKAIIGQMEEIIRLIGRLVTRKTKNFINIRAEIFYYIPSPFLYSIDGLNYDNKIERYEERITELKLDYLSKLAQKIDDFAKNKQYWNDELLKEKIKHLLYMVSVYQKEDVQLSIDLGLELKASIGDVLINSLHAEDQGKISLLLKEKEVLSLDVTAKNISVTKYSANDFEYMFDDATYIETPLLINEEFDLNFNKRSSYADILRKIKIAKKPIQKKLEYISQIIPGEIYTENDKFSYKVMPTAKELPLSAMASGVKSFNILQLLVQGGFIGGITKLLIIDEPENHLHPEWQLKYAELIVSLVAQGASIILTSHSPYMIEALYYYAKKLLDKNKVAFYYTEKTNIKNYTEIKETTDLSIIFDKLSKPLEQLVWDK